MTADKKTSTDADKETSTDADKETSTDADKETSTDADKETSTKESKEETSFQVQWLLSHNGKDYPAGETITLSDDEATPLLESGVIKLSGDKNDN